MSTSAEFMLKYNYDSIVQGCNTVEVSSHFDRVRTYKFLLLGG
jgi:hypothetical protein